MNLRRRGILVVVLALVTMALSAIVPAVVWKNLVFGIGPYQPTTASFWDVRGGQTVLWWREPARFGRHIVEALGTGVTEFPDTTEAMRHAVPGWVRLPENPEHGYSWSGDGYGWPFAALTMHEWYEYGEIGLTQEMDRWSTFAFGLEVTMPTRVYWPGMLGNLAVFAAFWGALLILPRAVRRLRRKRRAACLECGYDVRSVAGGVCPECGGRVNEPRTE